MLEMNVEPQLLCWPPRFGHADIVGQLLEHKDIDVNAKDFGGKALMWAAENEHRLLRTYEPSKLIQKRAAWFGHADIVGQLLSKSTKILMLMLGTLLLETQLLCGPPRMNTMIL